MTRVFSGGLAGWHGRYTELRRLYEDANATQSLPALALRKLQQDTELMRSERATWRLLKMLAKVCVRAWVGWSPADTRSWFLDGTSRLRVSQRALHASRTPLTLGTARCRGSLKRRM